MSTPESMVGKKARITEGGGEYFAAGHTCVITRFDGGDYWADFNVQGNSFVKDDGVWCIGRSCPGQFELIEN